MTAFLIAAVAAVVMAIVVVRRSVSRQRKPEVSGIDALMQWSDEKRLERWRRYVLEDQGPVKPEQGYRLIGVDKVTTRDGEIRFEARWYRWDATAQTVNGSGSWRPLEPGTWSQTSEPPPETETYPADTPIHQLAEAWTDFSLRVGKINEAHYVDWQREREAFREETKAQMEKLVEPLRRLHEAQAVADLLPHVGAGDPFADEEPQRQTPAARRRGSR